MPATRAAQRSIALACTLLGLALSVWMAFHSDGVHHDDDLVHLQMARWSLDQPAFLLHEWGRPGFTVLYALPAQLGWLAARLFSGLLTALTAWLCYEIAGGMGLRWSGLAPALLWLQPMSFTLSYTTLTETALAFYLALAVWTLMRHRFAWSAALISLCIVTRHEAAVFVPIWALAFWKHRRPWFLYAWLVWAPIAHNVLSAIFLRDVPLLLFLQTRPTAEYGQGDWTAMLARWQLAAGASTLVLAFVGAGALWRQRNGWIVAAAGLAFFLAHTLIYRFGLFASAGYYRFLVSIGPTVAICAAAALSAWFPLVSASSSRESCRRLRRLLFGAVAAAVVLWLGAELETPAWMTWALRWVRQGTAALAAVAVAGALLCAHRSAWIRLPARLACPFALLAASIAQPVLARGVEPPYQMCAPLRLGENELLVQDAANWLQAEGLTSRHIVAANAWVDEFLGRQRSPFETPTRRRFEAMQPGDLFVWDLRYAESPSHNIRLEELRSRGDLHEIWVSRPHRYDGIYCRVFEKRAAPAAPHPASPR